MYGYDPTLEEGKWADGVDVQWAHNIGKVCINFFSD